MAYTNIDDPSAHFQIATYTGDGSTSLAITNDGNSDLKPDLAWVKRRDSGANHNLFDSSRGATTMLYSDLSNAEYTNSQSLKTFNTDGFTLGNYGTVNAGSGTFVAWQWKANGGTTVSNTDGTITSTVQANQDAGFSIITYTGNGTQSGQTVGHGLGAVPKMIISKDRNNTSNVTSWRVYHEGIGNTKYLELQSAAAQSTYNDWDNTTPTSSVYSVGGAGGYTATNTNLASYLAYVFADVQGYSKFGKYVGNGSADGPFVYTGFKPAFLIMKRTDSTGAWHIFDNKRSGYNYANDVLQADATAAELSGQTYQFVDFLSNGFKNRRTTHGPNISGGTYIYMAFAENPFVTSTGVPTTAR